MNNTRNMSNMNNTSGSNNMASAMNPVNTMPGAATTDAYTTQHVPLNQIQGNNSQTIGREFLVQNHPDTVNNHGKGHNNNAGKIEVASLNPQTGTNMNANPAASNLSNVATTHTTIPNAPMQQNNNGNWNAGPHMTDTHNKAHNAKEAAKHPLTSSTNIVGDQAIATHLSGNPSMNTNTHIQNNATANMGSNDINKSRGLAKNANIADEINTNPVATTHPHANTSHGDIHTNQIVNTGLTGDKTSGHHLRHHDKHSTLPQDTTAQKETMQYH